MANQKISTYLTEVLALIPNDRLDISKEISPGVFDTQFLKYSTLLTELNGDLTVDNLYTADDDLTGNRTVGLLANELTFASTIDANLLKLETTFGRVGVGTGTPTAKLEVVGVSSTNADFSTKFNSATKNLLSLRNDGFVHFGEAATYPSLLQGGSAFINLDNGLTPIWQVQEVNRRISWGGGGVLEMEGSATTYIQGTASGFAYAGTASNDEYRIRTNNVDRIWVNVSGNVGIGSSTPSQKLDVAGNVNLASILSEGLFHLTDKILHRTGGASNTFLGQQSGESTSGDSNNSAFGYRALQDVVGGTQNNAFGSLALSNITTGLWNNAFGKNALDSLNGASQNANSAFGQNSITALTSGLNNSSFGGYSLAALTSGDNNTSLGYNSALSVTGGNNNTFLGAASGGATSGSYSNSIALGYKALITGDNQMVVGNIGGKINEIYLGSGVETDNIIGTDLNIYTTSTAAGNVDQSPSMDWIFNGSQGTGTGAGGDIIFKTAKSGTTGSTQNPLAEILRIKETGVLNVVNIPTAATGLVAGDIYSNGGVLTVV